MFLLVSREVTIENTKLCRVGVPIDITLSDV